MRSLDSRDHLTPVLGCRPVPCSTAPGAFEDVIQEKHGHVATHAITLRRNTGDGFNHCLPKPRLKCVELQNIRPCREIRVSSAGENASMHLNVGCRFVPVILNIPVNEVLGMLGDPRVIRRYVVGHEIQEQLHASLRKLSPGNGKACGTSEVFVNHIASYAVGRSDVVFWLKIE